MSLIQTEDRDEGVRILRIDNGKPNAVSTAMSTELIAALEAAEKDANAVILTGRPGMFSAGFDLGTMGEGPKAAAEMVANGGRLALAIYNHPKPIVGAISGHAVAMGLFMAMVCDYRIGAAGKFKYQANETAIGMTLPDFAIQFSRAALSKRHFDRVIVQSEQYGPEGARDSGMIDEVVEADALEARALEVATHFATNLKQPAFRNNKRLSHGPVAASIAEKLEADIQAAMGG
ncbi:MAG: crotonase/enoyl-CoA hydratase family protein [bacterium]|nr:crotonase/enoyl-CoA hydratase family protein [bacterium]